MTSRFYPACPWCLVLLPVWLLLDSPHSRAELVLPQVIYATAFEASEGYDAQFALGSPDGQPGQNGWRTLGSGGNGLLPNAAPGQGQAAYVGYWAPTNATEDQLNAWYPLNLGSIPTNRPIIRFSTLMSVEDSTNQGYDCFRWTVFNPNVESLLTLDFDNFNFSINYRLQGSASFIPTGKSFTNGVAYQLVILMDFAQNLWSATLEHTVLVTNQPISVTGAALNLGDIDAVWFIFDPTQPGDNFMVFDNYQVVAEAPPTSLPPPRLEVLGHTPNGPFLLRLFGQNNCRYAIDVTADLDTWTAIRTNVVADGSFDFVDTSATGASRRFYRARLVP